MKTQVLYLGERLPPWGKPSQVFRTREGKEVLFSGIKGVWFGYVYEAEVKPDGGVMMSTRPKEIVDAGWGATDAERAQYETDKLIVSNYRTRLRERMTLKKPHPQIAQAADLLRPFYRGLSDQDRRRFVNWLAEELSRKKK